MDDFSVSSLSESKNEWCVRLLNILTPAISQGLKSIFDEAWKLCQDNKEIDKYLMTFQNFLTRVPKWNQTIIDTEKTRITETSGCTYLEDLVTCVHIIQLKALTCVRVGIKQKKIDINVPSISDFIHKIYIHVARKIYTNIYLFEKNIAPLQTQKNNREIEILIKECILNAIRDSVPVETILRAYMDETEEQDVEVKETEEPLPDADVIVPEQLKENISIKSEPNNDVKMNDDTKNQNTVLSDTTISFADEDMFVDTNGISSVVNVPKDEKGLEIIEKNRNLSFADDNDDERLTIGGNISLDVNYINDLSKPQPPPGGLPLPELEFEVLT